MKRRFELLLWPWMTNCETCCKYKMIVWFPDSCPDSYSTYFHHCSISFSLHSYGPPVCITMERAEQTHGSTGKAYNLACWNSAVLSFKLHFRLFFNIYSDHLQIFIRKLLFGSVNTVKSCLLWKSHKFGAFKKQSNMKSGQCWSPRLDPIFWKPIQLFGGYAV